MTFKWRIFVSLYVIPSANFNTRNRFSGAPTRSSLLPYLNLKQIVQAPITFSLSSYLSTPLSSVVRLQYTTIHAQTLHSLSAISSFSDCNTSLIPILILILVHHPYLPHSLPEIHILQPCIASFLPPVSGTGLILSTQHFRCGVITVMMRLHPSRVHPFTCT